MFIKYLFLMNIIITSFMFSALKGRKRLIVHDKVAFFFCFERMKTMKDVKFFDFLPLPWLPGSSRLIGTQLQELP